MGGIDGLNPRNIEALTKYYSGAIVKNDTVEGMANDIWATFYHVTSTDKKPRHDLCPPGKDSWCFMKQYDYKVAEERKVWIQKQKERQKIPMTYKTLNYKRLSDFVCPEMPSHDSMNVRLKFEEGSVQYQKLYEVYKKAADPELLSKCIGHNTQNPNESFHSKIWKLCHKHKYAGSRILQFAMCQSILYHHLGYKDGNILNHFEIEITKEMETFWKIQEASRTKVVPPKPKKRKIEFKPKRSEKLQKQQKQYKHSGYEPGAGGYSWQQ